MNGKGFLTEINFAVVAIIVMESKVANMAGFMPSVVINRAQEIL